MHHSRNQLNGRATGKGGGQLSCKALVRSQREDYIQNSSDGRGATQRTRMSKITGYNADPEFTLDCNDHRLLRRGLAKLQQVHWKA